MMKKDLLFSMAAFGLLNLSSCASGYSSLQTTQSPQPPAEAAAAAFSPEASDSRSAVRKVRREEIPQFEVDALSVYQRMINYFTPERETAPVVSSEQLTAYVDYPAGSVTVNARYGNNPAELARLKQQLSALLRDNNRRMKAIRLTGFASPDGDTKENERLAGGRAIQFKNYLLKELKLPNNGLLTIDWAGEDWDGLRRLLSGSGKGYAANALAAIDSTTDPDKRRTLLKALNKGETYKEIEKTLFSRLRRMQLTVEFESQQPLHMDKNQTEQLYTNPEKLSLAEMLRLAAVYRPGTEQYREVYEVAAYTYPSCAVAQLNAAAASLALGDKEAARYFLQQVNDDPRSYNNQGVLALMEGDAETAAAYFRKSMPQTPRLARENLKQIHSIH